MTVKIWELSHSMMLFFALCKEAEKFTFLLLPTFDRNEFFFLPRQTTRRFLGGWRWLIVVIEWDTWWIHIWIQFSVHKCHHNISTINIHSISQSLIEQVTILKWRWSRSFDFITPSIHFKVVSCASCEVHLNLRSLIKVSKGDVDDDDEFGPA